MPVIPTNVWRLEGRRLHEAQSPGLIALGVIAPLWEHKGEYLISLLALACPFLVLWLLLRSPRSRRRAALLSIVTLAAVPYLFVWLYTVVLLSYLSLPLVVVVSAVSTGMLPFARRSALRAGLRATTLTRVGRLAAIAVATLIGLALVGLAAGFARMASYSASLTFDEPPVQAPLAKAFVTRVRGVTKEVFVSVASGIKLDNVVNRRLFDGFDPAMTRDEAEQRLGPPSGRWDDPAYKVQASYYDRPDGRVSLVRHGGSQWSTVGYPSACSHDYVFRDSRVRDQILQWLPPQETIQVNVSRSASGGGLTVFLNRVSCTYLVLGARDDTSDGR
jgi:hypothetical protein